MSAWVNTIATSTGKLRPVCEMCDKRGRPIEPRRDGLFAGEIDSWDLPRGWTEGPYPADFIDPGDGSRGSRYTCPDCNRKLATGEWIESVRGGRAQRLLGV